MLECLHELSPCVSPTFVCCPGDLVVHLLQGGRGGISGSEVVSLLLCLPTSHDPCLWVQLKRWCVWVLQRGNSGDGCDLASTLCKYDLRKGDVFVLRWARV